ncbi:ArsR family transcriptional regulator [bacterium]|nr:MAG: ArsR family transcriptional regulator [bacterium]
MAKTTVSVTSQSAVEVLSQLGDVVRLRMLRVLEQQELAVGELVRVLQIPQSSGSRHLRVLADGGWLFKRTSGPAAYYRVALDDLPIQLRSIWVILRDQLGNDPSLREDDRRLQAVLAERMTDSAGFFGRVAGEWDDLRNDMFGRAFTDNSLLGFLNPTWRVADLGCGTGNATELMSPWVEHVSAVDRSPEMLDAAKERLREAGHNAKNVDFIQGELTDLPLENKSIDVAACVLVLHHVDEHIDALKEMKRVLRTTNNGGMLLIVDMCAHDRHEYKHAMGHVHLGFSEKERIEMFKEADFKNVRVNKLRPDIDASGPSLFAAVAQVE